MADYFLTIGGSDSNAGTSPGASWRTWTKSLGAAGIASGDRLFVGPGIYRELTTINMTSATVETQIIGDITGLITNSPPGEVRLTAYTKNDESPASSTTLIDLNTRDFLTFKNITFVGAPTIIAAAATSTDIKFLNCAFLSVAAAGGGCISMTCGFGIAANWLFRGCYIFLNGTTTSIQFTLTTGSGSDYDANIRIENCLIFNPVAGIRVIGSGASAQEGGGVYFTNCTMIGSGSLNTSGAVIGGSTFAFPVIVRNCLMFGVGISSGELGAIVENYNIIAAGTPRTNVRVGPQSTSDGSVAPLIHIGQEQIGSDLKPFGMPLFNSPLLSHGDRTISNITDIIGQNIANGQATFLFDGTATAGGAITLTDGSKNFGNSSLVGYTIKITEGMGIGQSKTIKGNTPTVISGDGNWLAIPNTTSKYVIYQGPTSSTGPVTATGINTISDANASWGTNFWAGYTCEITSGVGVGSSIIVSGNGLIALTGWNSFATAPDTTSSYALYWGSGTSASGIDYIHAPVGCYAYKDSAVLESGIVLSGNNSIKLLGTSCQDFELPVDKIATSLSVWTYANNIYSGKMPSVEIFNGSGVGVWDQTGISTASTGAWGQIIMNFTPTNSGYLTIRLCSQSSGVAGVSYWDAISLV